MLSQIEWKKLLVIAVLAGVIVGGVSIVVGNAFGILLSPVWMGVISGVLFSGIWALLTSHRTSR